MAHINLTLQGKGGVGKSYVASLLAQYHRAKGADLQCYDTDPVNQTFAGFKAFGTEIIRLGDRPDEINPRYFDGLIEKIMAAPADAVIVIDNGASTFLPFIGYAVESGAFDLLAEAGHTVTLHSVITGGQALNDTLTGLGQILGYMPDFPVVVWLNEFFGRIERRTADGDVQGFEQSGLYKKNKNRIQSMIRLPEVRKETFGHDVEAMLRARLTFEEVAEHPDFALMSRQRLLMTWRTIFAAMDQAVL